MSRHHLWVLRLTLIFSCSFLGLSAMAQSLVLTVTAREAKLYTYPDLESQVVGRVKEGRKMRGTGEEVDGFFRVQTRSKKPLWIETVAVVAEASGDWQEDIVGAEDSEPQLAPARLTPGAHEPEYRSRFTFDLGASVGEVNDINYTEAQLGLNWYWHPNIAWRNALWGRFAEDIDTFWGVDTSMRGFFRGDLGAAGGLTIFAGPGYRFVNEGDNVAFAEGGLVLRLGPFAIGGGVKRLFLRMANRDNEEDDTQYFLILSGGGQL